MFEETRGDNGGIGSGAFGVDGGVSTKERKLHVLIVS
jgi:hypothetical protein